MFPTVAKLGPITIHSYGVMLAVGFLVVLFLVRRDARKVGLDPDALADMAFWTLVVGLAGTRILYIIMYRQYFTWDDPIGWIAVWRGGLVFQGAIPPAIIFCYYYLRKKHLDFRKAVDVVFPYIPLGHAIGRMGCFLNGCCFGAATSVPWAVRFPPDACERVEGMPQGADLWSLPLQPTQLYGVVGLATACLLLLWLRKKWHPFPGFTMPVYFMLYGVGRFIVEFFRGDHNPILFASLSSQQIFSIVFALFGLWLFFLMRTKKPRRTDSAA